MKNDNKNKINREEEEEKEKFRAMCRKTAWWGGAVILFSAVLFYQFAGEGEVPTTRTRRVTEPASLQHGAAGWKSTHSSVDAATRYPVAPETTASDTLTRFFRSVEEKLTADAAGRRRRYHHYLPILSQLPSSLQYLYWNRELDTLLSFGTRVAGMPNRTGVMDFLSQPPDSVFAATDVLSAVSEEGRALIQRRRRRGSLWLPHSDDALFNWRKEVDTFAVEIPVDLDSSNHNNKHNNTNNTQQQQQNQPTTVSMHNLVFHLPSLPIKRSPPLSPPQEENEKEVVVGKTSQQQQQGASTTTTTTSPSLSRWISHKKRERLRKALLSEVSQCPNKNNNNTTTTEKRDEETKKKIITREEAAHEANRERHIVLAAHWDTKWEPTGMLGAIDSTVSLLILQQLMRDVLWWRELNILIRLALEEEEEEEEKKKNSNSTASNTRSPVAAAPLRELATEAKIRALLEQLLHPSYAAVLLEYTFPLGLTEEEGQQEKTHAQRGASTSKRQTMSAHYHHYTLLDWLTAVEHLPAISIQFLDGEEAFIQWENDDHTYGSRHLAEEWKRKPWRPQEAREQHWLYQPSSLCAPPPSTTTTTVEEQSEKDTSSRTTSSRTAVSPVVVPATWMSSVDAYILLDLIGSRGKSTFRNLFPDLSGHLYEELVRKEEYLHREGKRFLFFTASGRDEDDEEAVGEGEEKKKNTTTAIPFSWLKFGIPSLWYQPSVHTCPVVRSIDAPPPHACGAHQMVAREVDFPRDAPLLPGGKLLVEDDHIHWLQDAARPPRSRVSGEADEEDDGGMLNMLHLIPLPFPAQWHTAMDDAAHTSVESIAYMHQLLLSFLFFP